MFGFGRSDLERSAVQLFSGAFSAMGLGVAEAKKQATVLIDEVAKELKARHVAPSFAHQGDIYAESEEFMKPRLAAGLTVDDVRMFWNRSLLIVFSEMKIREKVLLLHIEALMRKGDEWQEEASILKRDMVRYGSPDQAPPKVGRYNAHEDRFIYPEFSPRVDAWERKTPDQEKRNLVAQHGTLNAVVRYLVANHRI